MTDNERMPARVQLIATIPKLPLSLRKQSADDSELMFLHQDPFAANCQENEYALPWNGDQICWPSREGSACDREEPKLTTLDLSRAGHCLPENRRPCCVFDFRPTWSKNGPKPRWNSNLLYFFKRIPRSSSF